MVLNACKIICEQNILAFENPCKMSKSVIELKKIYKNTQKKKKYQGMDKRGELKKGIFFLVVLTPLLVLVVIK